MICNDIAAIGATNMLGVTLRFNGVSYQDGGKELDNLIRRESFIHGNLNPVKIKRTAFRDGIEVDLGEKDDIFSGLTRHLETPVTWGALFAALARHLKAPFTWTEVYETLKGADPTPERLKAIADRTEELVKKLEPFGISLTPSNNGRYFIAQN